MINEKFKQVALRETIFDKISNLLFASKIKTFEKNEAYYFVFLNEICICNIKWEFSAQFSNKRANFRSIFEFIQPYNDDFHIIQNENYIHLMRMYIKKKELSK